MEKKVTRRWGVNRDFASKKTSEINPVVGKIEMYSHFRKHFCPNKNIGDKIYRNVLSDFSDILVKKLILENAEYKIPYGLGIMRIKKYKPNYQFDNNGKLIKGKPPIDWQKTRNHWKNFPETKKVKFFYFNNYHSEDWHYRWIVGQGRATTVNRYSYLFLVNRKSQRLLGTTLRDENFRGDFYTGLFS